MHLEGPWLSLNGRKKGKVKFRNAEEAQRARELDASWKELLKRQGLELEEIEILITRQLAELGDEVQDIEFVLDVNAVAELVQPETNKILSGL
jgi:hypothetical protein